MKEPVVDWLLFKMDKNMIDLNKLQILFKYYICW